MFLVRSTFKVISINWHNRALVLDLIKRDFRLRYLGSVLGSYWNFLHPLAMIAIYAIVFSQVMKARLGAEAGPFSFTLYLCAGLLPWTAFVEMISRGSSAFYENAQFIKKISFPKEVLQTVVSGSAIATLFISLSFYILLLLVTSHPITMAVLLLPFVVGCQILLGSGLGMILSVMNVFFRDVQQLVSIILQVWFWLTPIVYLESLVPERFGHVIALNPMYYIIKMYQKIFYEGTLPDTHTMIISASIGGVAFAIGSWIVWYFRNELVDEL